MNTSLLIKKIILNSIFLFMEKKETDPFDALETEFSADEH